jgi:diketogulonate reductase-like aldo/keto reductase
MANSISQTIRLNNSVDIPALGLGVYQMKAGEETENAVKWALEAGYRLIDTAKLYSNEESVGKAIRESGIPREEIFVTTKLWPTDFLNPEEAFERSFKKLNLEYVDLYLIHFPVLLSGERVWNTFEKLYAEKRVRAIGVSNYSVKDLSELLATCSVPPAVNQVRFNPFDYKKELLEFCKEKNIVVEAYSPLTQGRDLSNPVIVATAQAHKKSPAQIMIRWALQQGTVVIPKSSKKERIEENSQVFDFELNSEEMKNIAILDA